MDRFVVRANDLIVEDLDDGLVVYDGRLGQAHYLDARATTVFRLCGQPRSERQIAEVAGLDAGACEGLVSQLIDIGMIEIESGSGFSRRAVLRTAAKVGLAGAAMAPVISAVIPVAAAHASTGQSSGSGGSNGGTPQYVGAHVHVALTGGSAASYQVTGSAGVSNGTFPMNERLFVDYQGNAQIQVNGAPGVLQVIYDNYNGFNEPQVGLYNDTNYAVTYSYTIMVGSPPSPYAGNGTLAPHSGWPSYNTVATGSPFTLDLQFMP